MVLCRINSCTVRSGAPAMHSREAKLCRRPCHVKSATLPLATYRLGSLHHKCGGAQIRVANSIYWALRRLGLRGSESNFRRRFAARFPHLRQPARAAEPAWHPPAPRRLAALLLGIALPNSPRELAWLDRACALFPRLGRCRELARQFRHLLECRAAAEIDGWIESARHSPLHRFAHSLLTDLAAVRQAASSEFSQGPVEGAVHRLKLLKRQMYGRAKLDLLRVRVCRPA